MRLYFGNGTVFWDLKFNDLPVSKLKNRSSDPELPQVLLWLSAVSLLPGTASAFSRSGIRHSPGWLSLTFLGRSPS